MTTSQLVSRVMVPPIAGFVIVAAYVSVEALVEPLALVILPYREAVGELFEARHLLEPAIAALAARRATREELAEMERILAEQAREVARGRTGMAQDSALHAAIAQSAHNRAIVRRPALGRVQVAAPSCASSVRSSTCSPRAGRKACILPGGRPAPIRTTGGSSRPSAGATRPELGGLCSTI